MAISNISGSSAIAGNKDSKAWDQTTSFGGFYPIQTIVVPSLGAASVSFTNIPQNFTHLQLRCAIRTNTKTQDYMKILYNNTDVVARHGWYTSNAGTPVALGGTGATDMGAIPFLTDPGGVFDYAIIDILDYSNINKTKVIKAQSGYDLNGVSTNGQFVYISAFYNSTAPITSLAPTLYYSTSYAPFSQFALYGVK